jgi:UPF0716 protein FxsA
MFPVLVIFLLLPVVELWITFQVAGAIGVLWTFLLLVGMSVVGLRLLRGSGVTVWRRAQAELAAGRAPTRSLLDGALGMVGAVLLIVPGFLTGALGALLVLPPVRALVRPLLLAWMTRRAARLARSGRLHGVMVDTVVGADGRVRTRTRTTGQVIDAEGWDVGDERSELPAPHAQRPGPVGRGDGPVIDITGTERPSTERPGDADPSGRPG